MSKAERKERTDKFQFIGLLGIKKRYADGVDHAQRAGRGQGEGGFAARWAVTKRTQER